MGMPILIDVRDQNVGAQALSRAFEFLRFIDDTFSTYKADSEISRINRGDLDPESAHADVREVLARCEELRVESGGFFDIRAPYLAGPKCSVERTQTIPIDPSGLVKGWSVERAGRILEAAGARNYAINAGGDILVRGRPTPDPYWRMGIQHPKLRDSVAAVVGITNQAIATSGAYERGAHILDPNTGKPPTGVLSVTIVGPDLATADAFATAAFAMGVAGPAWTARLDGYEAMTIMADETVLFTMNFPSV